MATTKPKPEPAPNPTGAAPPPQNQEAERHVLGALLLSERAITTVTRLLTPQDFYLPAHGTIYTAIQELHAAGVPVERDTVEPHLRDTQRWNEPVATALLETAGYVSTGNVHVYAKRVRDEATKYRIRRALLEQLQAIDQGTDAAAAVNRLAATATRIQTAYEAADETQQRIHAWTPTTLADGDDDDVEPERILGLFYPDKRHLLYGEPESLKTWVALAAIADTAIRGRPVFLVDHEMSRRVVRNRLTKLGLTRDQLDLVHYVKPETALDDTHRPHLAALLDHIDPALVVVDAFTGALGLAMLDDASNTDVERWMQTIGALLWGPEKRAFLIIDHVVKLEENRGRWPAGSKRKLESSDVAFSVKMIQRLGRGAGENGRAIITRQKDRPAWLPAGKYQADFTVAENGAITYTITATRSDDDAGKPFRPTALMERVSRFVEDEGAQGIAKKSVELGVRGKNDYKRSAIEILLAEGYLRADEGGHGRAIALYSVRAYREALDPNLAPSPQPRPNLAPGEGTHDLAPSPPSPRRGGRGRGERRADEPGELDLAPRPDEPGELDLAPRPEPTSPLAPGSEAWIRTATHAELQAYYATLDPEETP